MKKVLRYICFVLLCYIPAFLFADEYALGLRVSMTAGQGSGKGFWDWTETGDRGNLFLLPGGGLALQSEIKFNPRLILEISPGFFVTRAGLRLNDRDYIFQQYSFELPMNLKFNFPGKGQRWYTGVGPVLYYLPFEATWEESSQPRLSSYSTGKLLFGFCAGVDFLLKESPRNRAYLSFRFNHPFLSPRYRWIPEGSGYYRFNHIDLSFSWLWQIPAGEDLQ